VFFYIQKNREEIAMFGEITRYQLTDEELELVRKGQYDKIPTGEQRGLIPTVPDPPSEQCHTATQKKQMGRKPVKYNHITKEHLESERAAGKTIDQISADNGIPRGTLTWMLKKHGISGYKKGARAVET
jgi:hypothetical protein